MSVPQTPTGNDTFIRQPRVARRFYTDKYADLQEEVQNYLGAAKQYVTPCAAERQGGSKANPPLAVMLPHAGYVFSGIVTGLTLGQINLPDTVILLGPNHTGLGAPLAIWPQGSWITPLGAVPINTELADSLLANTQGAPFRADTLAHRDEHSLEVLLPFLQVLKPDIQIVPLCVAEYDPATLAAAGLALADAVNRATDAGQRPMLIGSTDMSHYLPHDKAKSLDTLALEQVEALNPEGLFQTVRANKISMCGVAPITLMLHSCKYLNARQCCLTAYTNSGITGARYGADLQKVVGYAGAIII